MLRDLDSIFQAVERWGTSHPILAWVVMGWLGGVVAVIRMYERVGVEFTWAKFAARGVAKGVIGAFVSAIAFFGWRAMQWSQDWGILVAGMCGIFGTDILEAVLVLGWDVLRKRFGLDAAKMPTSKDSQP